MIPRTYIPGPSVQYRVHTRTHQASQQQHQPPSRLSSASTTATTATPPTTYRIVSIRFLCASSGVFAVSGLAPQDQALLPTWVMDKVSKKRDNRMGDSRGPPTLTGYPH